MLKIIFQNILGYDGLIICAVLFNVWVFFQVKRSTKLLYDHFNEVDRMAHLNERSKKAILSVTEKKKKMTSEELLTGRENMNRFYSLYLNLTSSFPLFGMFGTVISLLSMVSQTGLQTTSAFFEALTSTFWGIAAAIFFKLMDSCLSYKIDDIEKHMEYLLNPVGEAKEDRKAKEDGKAKEAKVSLTEIADDRIEGTEENKEKAE